MKRKVAALGIYVDPLGRFWIRPWIKGGRTNRILLANNLEEAIAEKARIKHKPHREDITSEDRFWPNVEKQNFITSPHVNTPCWIWTGCMSKNGYGKFYFDGKLRRAHQFPVSPVPPGMLVCHKCDNRRCVRKDHLFVGSHLDNNRDCIRKGRRPKRPPLNLSGTSSALLVKLACDKFSASLCG